MPEQDVKAGELNKAEEVLDVVPLSGDEAAEVVHPSEEPFRRGTTALGHPMGAQR